MKPKTFRCACCRRVRPRNMRVKNQRYCGERGCQQMRKSRWQREREQSDPVYSVNKKECQRRWLAKNPGYWREYCSRHSKYCELNRHMQRLRDQGRSVPPNADLAKMDALTVKIIPVLTG